MFGVGGAEVVVIALVALIVLGPQRMAEGARTVGKLMGEMRQVSTGFQNELRSAMHEVNDSTTTTARRNVLGKDAPATSNSGTTTSGTVDDAVASIGGQRAPSPNGRARRPRRTEPLRADDPPAGGPRAGS